VTLPCDDVALYEDENRQHEARRACRRCPDLTACRERVLTLEARGEPVWGVAGGMLPSERPNGRRQETPRRGEPVPPRELAPCGTIAAYERHRKNGDDPCEPCRAARRHYERNNRAPYASRQPYGRTVDGTIVAALVDGQRVWCRPIERQLAVEWLMNAGWTPAAIAAHLSVSERSVYRIRRRIEGAA
jgi:hypothetical protein